ncbi:MAG: transport system permease protein [Bacteroidetes bacterium]|nr:transport system permease protein [Bacteroidota bacterium]
MQSRNTILFILLTVLLVILFLADITLGSIRIPFNDTINVFFGNSTNNINSEILLNFRLPKAITAILTGASLSVAGLMMQTLFRNPLADPYILGVSSGASLGVALVMMASSFLPVLFISSGWGLIIAAIIGAALVLLLVVGVSFKVQNSVSLLIVGLMFGTMASSLVSIMQFFSNPDAVKLFVMWNMGSLSAVTWNYMYVLFPVILTGLLISFLLTKRLDGLLLGENYARGLGIPIIQTRILIVIATGILAGSVTAFTGPIAFVGVAVPHIARGLYRSAKHQFLMPACILLGASLILICDIISQIPAHALPVNIISALFGAPVIIWIILKRK